MATAIGATSGVIKLAGYTFKSSVSLIQTVKGFRSSKREIRQLEAELEALQNVVQLLETASCIKGAQLEVLSLPLLRCGNACRDFENLIAGCTGHSLEVMTSFKDWAKLRWLGTDINGFSKMLVGYKSTITLALAVVNLQTTMASTNVIQELRNLLKATMADLHEHLQTLNDRLEVLREQGDNEEDETAVEEEDKILEEAESAKQCLAVCAHASEQLEKARTNEFEDVVADQNAHQIIVSTFGNVITARRVTAAIGATQWLGQMSDTALQQLSKSRGIGSSDRSSTGKVSTGEGKLILTFEDQYGTGNQL